MAKMDLGHSIESVNPVNGVAIVKPKKQKALIKALKSLNMLGNFWCVVRVSNPRPPPCEDSGKLSFSCLKSTS
jgi:hypothetical protein